MCPWCGGQPGSGMMGTGMMGFGWIGWIISLVFFVLIIVGVVLLIWWLVRLSSTGTSKKDSLEILKERYAKGGIGKKQYDEMKKDLGG